MTVTGISKNTQKNFSQMPPIFFCTGNKEVHSCRYNIVTFPHNITFMINLRLLFY